MASWWDSIENYFRTMYMFWTGLFFAVQSPTNPQQAQPAVPQQPQRNNEDKLWTQPFREAEVSCRMVNSNSEWGLLHSEHAGLILLDITIWQRSGVRLRWAQIEVIFNDYEHPSPALGPTVTTYLQPDILVSDRRIQVERERQIELAPNIQVAGNGGSLGRWMRGQRFCQDHLWSFAGASCAANSTRPTIARWIWQANRKDAVEYPRTFRTGFIIKPVSDGQCPIEIRIRGRLDGLNGKFRFGFKKPVSFTDLCPTHQWHGCLLATAGNLQTRIAMDNQQVKMT
ncbi:hypothetical protein ASPCADRAFT_6643 [Aspergillus carbonarius ITEM 5010]|uniref:Uncharacterized protein n=1 Tax=Aspergillus carbonarius (strain ITEM 5010) TaxID=602072 RepID=A0A1R3RKH0_ASPC5|nr:hypothetical protein ASPCADRAFT_6643 [Aspergillus carbonarius ITEM 5010]